MKINELYEIAVMENGKNASIRKLGGRRDLWKGDLRYVNKKWLNKIVFELYYSENDSEIIIYIK